MCCWTARIFPRRAQGKRRLSQWPRRWEMRFSMRPASGCGHCRSSSRRRWADSSARAMSVARSPDIAGEAWLRFSELHAELLRTGRGGTEGWRARLEQITMIALKSDGSPSRADRRYSEYLRPQGRTPYSRPWRDSVRQQGEGVTSARVGVETRRCAAQSVSAAVRARPWHAAIAAPEECRGPCAPPRLSARCRACRPRRINNWSQRARFCSSRKMGSPAEVRLAAPAERDARISINATRPWTSPGSAGAKSSQNHGRGECSVLCTQGRVAASGRRRKRSSLR